NYSQTPFAVFADYKSHIENRKYLDMAVGFLFSFFFLNFYYFDGDSTFMPSYVLFYHILYVFLFKRLWITVVCNSDCNEPFLGCFVHGYNGPAFNFFDLSV